MNRFYRSFSALLLTSISAAAVFSGGAANASCFGEGYFRTCDGRGGFGATYSPRGSFGSTTYMRKDGSFSRRQDYSTFGNTKTINTYYGY